MKDELIGNDTRLGIRIFLHLFLLASFNARRVLEKFRVHFACWQQNITHHRSADEAILHAHLKVRKSPHSEGSYTSAGNKMHKERPELQQGIKICTM